MSKSLKPRIWLQYKLDKPVCLKQQIFLIYHVLTTYFRFLARLDEVQEELMYYLVGVGVGIGVGVGVSKMLKLHVKVFYVMGKALSGELSCPCDRSCLFEHLYVAQVQCNFAMNLRQAHLKKKKILK